MFVCVCVCEMLKVVQVFLSRCVRQITSGSGVCAYVTWLLKVVQVLPWRFVRQMQSSSGVCVCVTDAESSAGAAHSPAGAGEGE